MLPDGRSLGGIWLPDGRLPRGIWLPDGRSLRAAWLPHATFPSSAPICTSSGVSCCMVPTMGGWSWCAGTAGISTASLCARGSRSGSSSDFSTASGSGFTSDRRRRPLPPPLLGRLIFSCSLLGVFHMGKGLGTRRGCVCPTSTPQWRLGCSAWGLRVAESGCGGLDTVFQPAPCRG